MNDLSAEKLGLKAVGKVYHNLSYDELFEHESRNKEGALSANGTMMVDTGKFTGRSPKDKYFVKQAPSAERLAWGKINQPVSSSIFDQLIPRSLIIFPAKMFMSLTDFAGPIRRRVKMSVLSLKSPGSPIL